MNRQTALLTGAGGGLGSCTARYLAERGWRVFATDVEARYLAGLEVGGISPLVMDVTDQASIDAAYRRVEAEVEGLDGLVNFAGIMAMGSMIEIDEAALFRVLNINVMGTFRVNRTFFPLILRRKGRIVNMSSEVGWQRGAPFSGAYGMSKHAIEAYSDSLRRELALLGVPVIKVQPGPFKTPMANDLPDMLGRAAEGSAHFGDALARMRAAMVREYEKAEDPIVVAQVVYEALTCGNPEPSYSVKPDPQRELMEKMSTRLADAILIRSLRG